MRILIVHNTLNDSRSVNGVLRHYVLMAKEWIAGGHRTDFVAARAAQSQLTELAPQSRLISSDGFFNATGRVDRTWTYFPAYAYRLLTPYGMRLPEKYDVVVASSQLIVETQAARILARRLRARLAVKIHAGGIAGRFVPASGALFGSGQPLLSQGQPLLTAPRGGLF
jgi:hypothetical protein